MNSTIKQLSSLISSSKDKRLNKKLLSIKKKVERIEKKDTKKLRSKIKKIDESSNPLEIREENKFRVKNIGYKTIESFLKGVKKKVLNKLNEIEASKDQYILTVIMQKPETEDKLHHFRSTLDSNEDADDREYQYDHLTEYFNRRVHEEEQKESGWKLRTIDQLDIEQQPFDP